MVPEGRPEMVSVGWGSGRGAMGEYGGGAICNVFLCYELGGLRDPAAALGRIEMMKVERSG